MTEATIRAVVTAPAPRSARLVRLALEVVLVVAVVVVLFALIVGRIVPMTGRQAIIIGGGSMEPSIHLGSVAITEPTAPTAVRVGDVVSVRASNDAIVTHRVVRIAERVGGLWFELKGDANPEPDPVLVDSATMLGAVTVVIPYAGFLLRFMSMPAGIVAILAFGATLILALYLLDEVAQPRRRTVATPTPRGRLLPDGGVLVPSVAYRRRPVRDDRTASSPRKLRRHRLHRGHHRRRTAGS